MKKFTFFIIFMSSLLMMVSFQNCGNVKLEPKELPSIAAPQAKALPQGSVCSGTGNKFGTPVRFAFIVDMSLSNLGGSSNQPGYEEGKYFWTLDLANSTDKDFKRMDAMKKFISTCGNSSEFKYSIIGFSSQAMFSSTAKRCTSSFESATEALASVEGFRKIQADDIAANGAYTSFSPFKMGDTSYKEGLDCLKVNIQTDVSTSVSTEASAPIYQTFFITDGQPTDFPTFEAQKTNYLASIKNMIDFALPFSSGIKMKTMYYGPDSQKATAKQILDVIAQSTGEMIPDPNFPDDPTKAKLPETLEIKDMDNLSAQLCELYKPQATYAYKSYQQTAINVNRVQYEKNYEPDSDADGISDKEEIKLGFDPLNPRSKGVLDSLCQRAGFDVSLCQAPAACIKDEVGIGLNDCDIKFANAYFGKTLNGFDTDADQIIDFVEIIRGTNPVIADMQADLDRDGRSNITEIIDGSGVNNKAKIQVDDIVKFDWKKSKDKKSCTGAGEENYDYNFSQVP
ncbi:MAG: thrombospondin type 3 repeat-containing protein, partial [Pseudobdellovibrio sp.]